MEFQLPAIGEGVTEGEVVRWLVKEGDAISVDQPLIEIMTDKATVEVPSPLAGKAKQLRVKPGELVKVGQVLLSLEEAEAEKKVEAPRPSAAAEAEAPIYMAEPGEVLATPSTRRLARDLGVDLRQVKPTGPRGRVTKEDVENFPNRAIARPQPPQGPRVAPSSTTEMPAPPAPVVLRPSEPRAIPPLAPGEREKVVPVRGVRRKIAEAMARSRQTIPEFTYVDECDVSELVAFRGEAKQIAAKQGIKLTYMPFIIKAAIQGLKAFPYLNASLDARGDEQGANIILKNYFNIGIAVDTEDGLIVPVIKDADRKSILEVAADLQSIVEKAHSRKLSLDDLQGGTFSVTNAGNIGGLMATPIINWPEVGILGVHKISKRPVVKNDQIQIADMIWLSVAIDHRVVDGAMAARFMNVVMEYLSSPKKLMLDMV